MRHAQTGGVRSGVRPGQYAGLEAGAGHRAGDQVLGGRGVRGARGGLLAGPEGHAGARRLGAAGKGRGEYLIILYEVNYYQCCRTEGFFSKFRYFSVAKEF